MYEFSFTDYGCRDYIAEVKKGDIWVGDILFHTGKDLTVQGAELYDATKDEYREILSSCSSEDRELLNALRKELRIKSSESFTYYLGRGEVA